MSTGLGSDWGIHEEKILNCNDGASGLVSRFPWPVRWRICREKGGGEEKGLLLLLTLHRKYRLFRPVQSKGQSVYEQVQGEKDEHVFLEETPHIPFGADSGVT